MSITVYEKFKSPRARFVNPTENNGSSIEFLYVVLGTDSEIAAANAALAIAPLAYIVNDEVLVRQEVAPDVTGPTSWEVSVKYGTEDENKSKEKPEPGTWHFSFDTTGGTHKITQSLQTLWKGERSQTNPAPDLLGAIGALYVHKSAVDQLAPLLRVYEGCAKAYIGEVETQMWSRSTCSQVSCRTSVIRLLKVTRIQV